MYQKWSDLYLNKKIIPGSLSQEFLANIKLPNGFLAKKCLGNQIFEMMMRAKFMKNV